MAWVHRVKDIVAQERERVEFKPPSSGVLDHDAVVAAYFNASPGRPRGEKHQNVIEKEKEVDDIFDYGVDLLKRTRQLEAEVHRNHESIIN